PQSAVAAAIRHHRRGKPAEAHVVKVCQIVTSTSYGCNNRFLASITFAGSESPQTAKRPSPQKEKRMLIKNIILRAAGASLAAVISLAVQPLRAQTSSESKEIEELKREVAELKREVNSLKKHAAPAPVVAGEGPTKTEITYDGKTYVEKTVPVEKSSADKWKLSTSISEMELY